MPKLIVPKRSGIHRFACLALYRALLRQCARLPPSVPDSNAVNFLVRHKFRKHKDLQSPSQTANALKAGYEALDLLHSASKGNKNDISRISALLAQRQALREKHSSEQRALTEATPPKPLSKKEKKKLESLRHQEATARRHPDAQPILSRPRPVVSGRRRVPVLVNARGVPFLRIKKPQPKVLSGVIRSKLDKRWKRIVRRERLEQELILAEDEDHWDRLVGEEERYSWTSEIKAALDEVSWQIRETDRKNAQLAEAMWNVVLKERELAEKEEAERQRIKDRTETAAE
ncbi:hypothetical protein VTN02DRAFT_5929 [Thermoascus thermophilus]